MALLAYMLIFLVIIVLVPILVLVFWAVGKFITLKRAIFGGGPQSSSRTYNNYYRGQQTTGTYGQSSGSASSGQNYGRQTTSGSSTQRGKIIPKDEGEYVEFEEVR